MQQARRASNGVMARAGSNGRCARLARGFSLVELLIVLAVTLILTSLILPSLTGVRENVNRVVCSSNLRQLGLAFHMYARDQGDRLPRASVLSDLDRPDELMAAHFPFEDEDEEGSTELAWDGTGLLFQYKYCAAPECFYCPSHRGEHALDADEWFAREADVEFEAPVYTNYHYAGHVDWQTRMHPRRLEDGERLVLLADGFRARSDINHEVGMNLLRGDGSVRFYEDSAEDSFYAKALGGDGIAAPPVPFVSLWKELEKLDD